MSAAVPTSKSRFHWRLAPFDVVWAILSPFIALTLRDPTLFEPRGGHLFFSSGYQFAALTIVCAVPSFLFFRLSDGLTRYFSMHDVWAVVSATFAIVAASDIILFVMTRLEGVPRSTPMIYGLVLAGGLLGGRALSRLSRIESHVSTRESEEPHLRRVILAGVDRFAAIVVKLTDCQLPRTTQIIAAVDPRERLGGRTINGVKIVGTPNDVETLIDEYRVHGVEIDEVWIADNMLSSDEIARIEHQCCAARVRVCGISEALNLTPQREPLFRVSQTAAPFVVPRFAYFRFKRALDVLVASLLIIALSPLALIVAGLTYIDVGGPVIFWQKRIGQGGREFLLYKFRTFQAPYARDGNLIAADRRLSKLGNLIRASRVDEIPQLFNILRGDMSLIGPRPLLPIDQPQDPSLRLLVRPGVTGWAQVTGGTLVTAEEKDALDVWYIHHASPMLDLNIIVRTLKIVLRGENKHHDAINAAVDWYKRARQIDQRLFHDDPVVAVEV